MVVIVVKTGIEVSKCVHLACMAVEIKHAVGGHNHDILQQCISVYVSRSMGPQPEYKLPKYYFCSSKLICIHGKLTKNKRRHW